MTRLAETENSQNFHIEPKSRIFRYDDILILKSNYSKVFG